MAEFRLKVPPEQLEQLKGEFQTTSNELRKNLDHVRLLISQLNEAVESDYTWTFSDYITVHIAESEKFCHMIDELSSELTRIAEIYQEAERTTVSQLWTDLSSILP